MANIVGIIQARMGSTRLPGKVLLELGHKSVLGNVIDRLSSVKEINKVVVATTISKIDNPIEAESIKFGAAVYRGDELDVLGRYYDAAKAHDADHVIRITSDCPCIDSHVIAELIHHYSSKAVDYASNTLERSFPRGLDAEIFSMEVLEQAYFEAKLPFEREHVTPFIYQSLSRFKLFSMVNKTDLSRLRLTLDTSEDYQLLKEVYRLLENKPTYHLDDLEKLFSQYPELSQINSHIEQKKLGE